jgi:hypothetical protein
MNDSALTIAAASFEIGLPVVVAATMIRRPSVRGRLAVLLGATVPFVLVYACISLAYFLNPADRGNRFAFLAGWEMSFVAYLGAVLVGTGLSLVRVPQNPYFRFFIGCAAIPVWFILVGVSSRVIGLRLMATHPLAAQPHR